jgi:hypothetical protein
MKVAIVAIVGAVAGGHAPGILNIRINGLRCCLDEVPFGRSFAGDCQSGQCDYLATRILNQHLRHAMNLGGGYTTCCQWHDGA